VNIDHALANRVFYHLGDEPLNQDDVAANNLKWRELKEFYLPTFLQAMEEVPWTRGKKRLALTVSGGENRTGLRYAYDIPPDCAKPLEIQGNERFIIEGERLFTDTSGAVLLYISNGRIAQPGLYLADDDFPEYDPPQMEGKFYEYFENMLAAKMAKKLSADLSLYQILLAVATGIKAEAVSSSLASSASKKNGDDWWFSQIGVKNG
jgi:hypothetical protein